MSHFYELLLHCMIQSDGGDPIYLTRRKAHFLLGSWPFLKVGAFNTLGKLASCNMSCKDSIFVICLLILLLVFVCRNWHSIGNDSTYWQTCAELFGRASWVSGIGDWIRGPHINHPPKAWQTPGGDRLEQGKWKGVDSAQLTKNKILKEEFWNEVSSALHLRYIQRPPHPLAVTEQKPEPKRYQRCSRFY